MTDEEVKRDQREFAQIIQKMWELDARWTKRHLNHDTVTLRRDGSKKAQGRWPIYDIIKYL